MNTRFFLPLMLSAALAGCAAVGPDYQVPAGSAITRPSAQAPFAEAQASVFQRDQVPGHWWRLYDDPVLDGLVEKALGANTDLRVASANLERAQAAVRETEAQQQPSLGVNASPTFGHEMCIRDRIWPAHTPCSKVCPGRSSKCACGVFNHPRISRRTGLANALRMASTSMSVVASMAVEAVVVILKYRNLSNLISRHPDI